MHTTCTENQIALPYVCVYVCGEGSFIATALNKRLSLLLTLYRLLDDDSLFRNVSLCQKEFHENWSPVIAFLVWLIVSGHKEEAYVTNALKTDMVCKALGL